MPLVSFEPAIFDQILTILNRLLEHTDKYTWKDDVGR